MLDFGYIRVELPSSWMVRVDIEDLAISMYSLQGSASASLEMYSANTENPESLMDQILSQMILRHRQLGLHVDDLSEDLDYEFLSEIPTSNSNTLIQHTFLRLCEDVIVRLVLRNHGLDEEETMRLMLKTLHRGGFKNSLGELVRMHPPVEYLEWDKLTGVVTSTGVD